MHNAFFNHVYESMPRMNPIIADGIATKQMPRAEVYLDRIWRCAQPLFPEGLVYLGYRRCTPVEEFRNASRKRGSRPVFELSRSDVFMVEYLFEFEGKPLPPRPVYLPFVGEAGAIYIRGSQFTISPVLADRCMSVSNQNIFIPLSRDRLTFEQFDWHIRVDGEYKSVSVKSSQIHHHVQDPSVKRHKDYVKLLTTIPHYLFGKHGFMETMALYPECTPVVGMEEINSANYPVEEWVIVSSEGKRPRTFRRRAYEPTQIRVAIRRSEWTTAVQSLLGGFFYVLDHFPERVTVEDVLEVRCWRTLLGLAIYGPADSEGKLVDDVESHFSSIDQYVDEVVREDLADDGLLVGDIYDLFFYIIQNMSDMMLRADSGNLEGKRYVTWKYVLYDLVSAIFHLTYQLRPKNKKLTERDIVNRFNRGLNAEIVMRINRNHNEVNSISSPGDSKIFKYSSNVVPQADATSRRRHGSDRGADRGSSVHASAAVVGSYLNLPKANPDPSARANPWCPVQASGEIVIPDALRPIIEETQRSIE